MGDIADMMLDGDMCQGCGVIFDDRKPYPHYCSACQKEDGIDEFGEKKIDKKSQPQTVRRKVQCKCCGKKVWEEGIGQHMKDKHCY